jgi:hypothetical protein
MALSRRRKILIAVLGVGVCGIAAYVALYFWVSAQLVAAHQRSTMQELVTWEREFSNISTAQEAERAAGILDYARNYYVVGPGYRSDPETEAKLEAQRRRTIDTIMVAIEEFKRREAGEASAPPAESTD